MELNKYILCRFQYIEYLNGNKSVIEWGCFYWEAPHYRDREIENRYDAPYTTASGASAMDVMNYAGKELSSYFEKTTI